MIVGLLGGLASHVAVVLAALMTALVMMAASPAFADDDDDDDMAPNRKKWEAPFGGFYSAALTVVSDYSFRGISQTNRQPALQPSLGYRTPSVSENINLWGYVGAWGSNVHLASAGPAVEVDLSAGLKWRTLGNRLGFEVGYVRYLFLGVPADLSYDYGEFTLGVSYNFGFVQVGGRLHYSPQAIADSGRSWSERVLLSVPLPFLKVNENVALKVYGSLGNQSVERYLQYGIPSPDYWYWQAGLVVSAYGLDITVAYTDTSIDVAGCGYTTNCQGRVILGVTKAF